MSDLHKINFWKRLEMFVSDVNVNDPMSEEEKDMILHVARTEQKVNVASVYNPNTEHGNDTNKVLNLTDL